MVLMLKASELCGLFGTLINNIFTTEHRVATLKSDRHQASKRNSLTLFGGTCRCEILTFLSKTQ